MKCKKCGAEFEGEKCPNCGEMGAKTMKPFYKKWWFITIIIIIVIAIIVGIIVIQNFKPMDKLDFSALELGEYLPEPDSKSGKIEIDRSDVLTIKIPNVEKQKFKDYVKKCSNDGYNIDLEYEDWDTVYGAFNKAGYNIRIIYLESDKSMNITLSAPEKMSKFKWPTRGLGSMLPATESTYGNISWDNSKSFIVHVGKTSIDEYNDYVEECEDKGYTVDYRKDKKSYSAENSDGYKLHLSYLGGNVIEVSLEAPEGTTTNNSSTENTQTSENTIENVVGNSIGNNQTSENTQSSENTLEDNNTSKNTIDNTQQSGNNSSDNSNNGEIRKEFKDAMDSYESFMDEYVAFMKKYKDSNGTDMSLMTDYYSYLNKYTKLCQDFEKWEEDDLNTAEMSYYIDVQARVNKKLLEVTN